MSEQAGAGTIDFEAERLFRYLDTRFGSTEHRTLERISGGQSNPTYRLDYGDRRLILRKQPNGPILRGAHAVDREYRVISALGPTGIPVPRTVTFIGEPALIGTPFYLMERVEGRIFTDAALQEVPREDRRDIWLGVADALAALHSVDPGKAGLSDFGRPGNYFERQIGLWSKQLRSSGAEPIDDLENVAAWLPENMPPQDGQVTITHGDFRIGNLIFHPEEPRVIAILDWELSTLGHPLADLGFCAIPWHSLPEEYGGLLGCDLEAEGLPAEEEFIERYFEMSTVAPPLRPFHKAFALFRFAVIFIGIAERVKQGNAAGGNADSLQPLAASFAQRAWEIAQGKPHIID